MLLNEALNRDYEIIGGEKFMAPMPRLNHSGIVLRLAARIFNYIDLNKYGYVFTDNVDVHFPDGNLLDPDLVVVTKENEKILDWGGAIYGVPDMVVEVLSPSTRTRDLTIKKDIYESNGVKEYWIVDPYMRTVDVYILRNGKYELDGSYTKFDSYEWENLSDKEKAEYKSEIKVSIFEDLFIKVDDIFSWGYED
ncbi:MAG: Uma2 family endonuclease [Selenomonadaceae bacterium]|nr:Uma2 family endonuclease [Selenomonadaceae bacterium]